MDRNETLKVLSLIKLAFPNSYSKMSNDELKALSNLWAMQFTEYDYNAVSVAVNLYISQDTSGYAPTIGQIKDNVRKLTAPEKTDYEIWEPIHKAIRNGYYNAKDEWERLPEDIKAVVSVGQIHDWSTRDSDEIPFIKNEIVKEYRAVKDKQIITDLLPASARNMLAGLSIKEIEESCEKGEKNG